MDVLAAIENRREITSFKEQPLPNDVMEKLTRALYLSPSGNNIPSRQYILVRDRQRLSALSEATPYMQWLARAAAGVVIIGDEQASKYWLQDASIAGGYLWLAATSLGLGAAWGAVYHSEDAEESWKREQHVRELTGVPDALRVAAVIGIGYPAAVPSPKEMYPLDTVWNEEIYRS